MHPDLAEHVGFSANMVFSYTKNRANQFAVLNSAYLVIKPAAGGKWLRALNTLAANSQGNQIKENHTMTDPNTTITPEVVNCF